MQQFDPRMLNIGVDDFEILRMNSAAGNTFDLLVTRSAINTASASAVDPSYIEALATSIPVSWQTSV